MAQQEGVRGTNNSVGGDGAMPLASDLYEFVGAVDGVGDKRCLARRIGAGIIYNCRCFSRTGTRQDNAISGWHL